MLFHEANPREAEPVIGMLYAGGSHVASAGGPASHGALLPPGLRVLEVPPPGGEKPGPWTGSGGQRGPASPVLPADGQQRVGKGLRSPGSPCTYLGLAACVCGVYTQVQASVTYMVPRTA